MDLITFSSVRTVVVSLILACFTFSSIGVARGDSEPIAVIAPLSPKYAQPAKDLYDYYTHKREKNYVDAILAINKFIEVSGVLFGSDHKTIAMGKNYLRLLYQEAETFYRRSLATKEKAFDPQHTEVGKVLNKLAYVFYDMDRYDEAETLYLRVINIYEKAYDLDPLDFAKTLTILASTYAKKGHFQKAETFYMRALTIYEKSLEPDHPIIANALSKLDYIYHELGRYNEAESYCLRAIAIYEKNFEPDHPTIAAALSNLATNYSSLGRYDEAESLYLRAVDIYTKAYGADHPRIAGVLVRLGFIHNTLGRSKKAETFYLRAIEVYEKTRGLDELSVAGPLGHLAFIYTEQGRYREAEALNLRAINILEQKLGPEHLEFSNALVDLAWLYYKLERYNEAVTLNLQALAIRQNHDLSDHPHTGFVQHNLGVNYYGMDRFTQAETHLLRALAIIGKALGPGHPNMAHTIHTLAVIYEQTGRLSEAESHYLRAINIDEKIGTPNTLSLTTLSNAYNKQGRFVEALEMVRKSTAILRNRFVKTGFDGNEIQLNQKQVMHNNFRAHVDLVLHPDQQNDRKLREGEAFDVSQLARISRTAGAIAQMAARFNSGNQSLARIIRDQQDTLIKLRNLESKLIETLGQTSDQLSSERRNLLREQLKSLDNWLDDLNHAIQEKFPSYAVLVSPKPLSLVDTQALLRFDEGLLTFLWSKEGDQIHVFVIRRHSSLAYTVKLAVKEMENFVSQLRTGVDTNRVDQLSDIPHFNVGLSHQLYKRLMAPAEEILSEVNHLFVVPEGALQSIPLGILVTQEPNKEPDRFSDYRDIAWLYKNYAITTLPSVASLRALRKFASKTKATKPFIGFGDPALSSESGVSKGLELSNFYRGAIADVRTVRKLPDLPGTTQDLKAMARYLGADDSMIYVREEATETQVKSLPLYDHKVVAFSTHGLISGELEGLVEPALVLTPPQKGTVTDDGLLTASEVAQLKLDADWVILSACNTASGNKPGAEGLSGLAKAFFYAGARTLLVSHWQVESNAATALTKYMFETIKRNPSIGRAEALRQSMLKLASGKIKPYYAHPVFWAPFVVVGEGGA